MNKDVRVRLKIEGDTSEVARVAASTQTALNKPIDEARRKAQMAANEDRKLYYETIRRLDAEEQAEKRRVASAADADRRLFYQTTERLKQQETAKDAALKKDQERLATIARQELQTAAIQRSQARQSLAMTGLGLSGLGGAAGGYGQGLAIGSGLEAMGYGGLARLAPVAGLTIGAGSQALDSAIQYRLATQNPFMSQTQREREYALALPGGQKALQLADLVTGTNYELGREGDKIMGRFQAEGYNTKTQIETRLQSTALDRMVEMRVADANLAATRTFQRPELRLSGDRGTFAGQRENTEAERRLQSANRVVEAERKIATASAEYRANLERANYLKNIGVELARKEESLQRSAGEGTPGDQIETRMKLQNIRELQIANIQEQGAAGVQIQRSRVGDAIARDELRKARIDSRQTEIQILEQREQTAAASGNRLVGLGVDGRARGMAALEALKAIGIENAPSSLIAEASSVAPLGVQDLADKAGQSLPELKRLEQLSPADAESRNLPALRDKIKREKEALPAEQQDADENLATSAAGAKQAVLELLKFMESEIPLRLKNIENAFRLSAIN